MTTAFVLSGGGSLGAVQVGMLQTLTDKGIVPDMLVGTSAGALNAAYVAGHGASPEALAGLADRWVATRRSDVFPISPRRQALAMAGGCNSLFTESGIRRLITRHVGYPRLEDARIPVHVVATDVLSGEEVLLSQGDAVSAILASTAIPAMLPPVRRDARFLVDGGLADNTAISQAVTLGADRIYVLPAGVACALTKPPSSALAAAVHALSFLTQQRLITDVVLYADRVDLQILPPLCPLNVAPTNFRHAAELIARARAASQDWLDHGRTDRSHPERVLSLHHHHAGPPGSRRTAASAANVRCDQVVSPA